MRSHKKTPDWILKELHYDPDTGYITSTPKLRLRFAEDSTGKLVFVAKGRMITGSLFKAHVHRLAFEILGIDIDGLDVHHKNHNHHDNRFCNLQPMTHSEHSRYHATVAHQRRKAIEQGLIPPESEATKRISLSTVECRRAAHRKQFEAAQMLLPLATAIQ